MLTDYLALNATYSIYPGNATISIPITILTDMLDENTERLSVRLSVSDGFEQQVRLGQFASAEVDITDGNGMAFCE